jgi:hypothetical protein
LSSAQYHWPISVEILAARPWPSVVIKTTDAKHLCARSDHFKQKKVSNSLFKGDVAEGGLAYLAETVLG